ncbi:MAG: dipeptidase [Chloroflexota bacterium]
MPQTRRRVLATAAAGVIAAAGARAVGSRLVARTERRLSTTHRTGPYPASDRARDLHHTLFVADLHADSLLWGRDLLRRGERGHVDVPRLIEGGIALEVLSASVKVPRRLNYDRNEGRTDDVTLLAVGQAWPPRTWRSLLARTLFLAERATRLADRSAGRLTLVRTRGDLEAYADRRSADPQITAALLSIEGAHALEDDPANLDRVADAGYRMISPAHFFDTAFGGSAHGVDKGGLTPRGRELVARMEARSILLDLAHASSATIDDALSVATRPVVASHTGVRGTCDNARNLPDAQLAAIGATGGVVGIGFWPAACCGDDAGSIARAIVHAIGVAGVDHVGLGSDFDGAVPVPFDATGVVQITDALLAKGLEEADVAAVMGGNVRRLLAQTLP